MRRASLGILLIGLNAALVLLAVLGMGAAAVGLLRRLAEEQALARVALAASAAVQAVERSAGDVRTSAELLAERPTLARLLAGGESAALAAFLERFRATSGLAGCAVVAEGRLVAASGPPLPWTGIAGAARPGAGPVALPGAGGPPLLAAAAPLPAIPGAATLAVLALDPPRVRRLAGPPGLEVRVLETEAALAAADEARLPVLDRALAGTGPAAGHLRQAGLYLAAAPLRLGTGGGRPPLLVQVTLGNAAVAASLSGLVRRLALLSLLVAGLATLFALVLGGRLARPVAALTAAAARIGRGDLETPMPAAPGAELGTLAAAMEEMRRRLLRQTAELSRRQAEGEAVLTGIAEGVFSVDRDRRIRYLNPQAAALLGIPAEAALGRFCGDVLRPQTADGVRPCEEDCPIVHARFRGGARATEQLLAADGGRRAVVITSAPPAEGQQFQVMRDETEAEAARRLRDAVLANVSHEFKTPLSAQLASIELLRERLAGHPDEEARGLVLALERGSLRLTQLIDNLLESVRIESGQDSIRRRPVALDEVVEEAVELTAPLVAQRGQRLAVELPYPLPAVHGDAPRLTQVFVNLLANANKFAPPASTIRVGGAVGDGGVSLWVEDEGPGLPGIDGRTLFGRFVRSPGDEEPGESGMGLGLWIVQSIVERHGGSVEARSAGPGTRVSVTLPFAASEAA